MRRCIHWLGAIVCLGLAACKTGDANRPSASNGGKIYAISSESAAFYRFGPQQGNGADTTLPRNTLVRLIRPSFGYSKVEVVDTHQQGYIASDDIRVAPPKLVAAANATPTPAPEQFNFNDPRMAAPQEQLPPPDLPPPSDTSSPTP